MTEPFRNLNPDFAQAGIVYQVGLPPRRVDILTEISGVDFDAAWSTRRAVEFEGRAVPLIGRDALLRNQGPVTK